MIIFASLSTYYSFGMLIYAQNVGFRRYVAYTDAAIILVWFERCRGRVATCRGVRVKCSIDVLIAELGSSAVVVLVESIDYGDHGWALRSFFFSAAAVRVHETVQ